MTFRPRILGSFFAAALLLSSCLLPLDPSLAVADKASTLANPPSWERSNTTIYQIWVSAFADSDGDGVGDLAGITGKIRAGYFTGLGINALWLSPIFDSPSLSAGSSNKHGYDTRDYSAIAPIYGTRDGLRVLINEAHAQGLRVLFDFVPNHTSSSNPWFTDPSKANWYVRSVTKPAGWGGFDSYSDWYWSGSSYYYGLFGGSMPDLNYRSPAVDATMTKVARDWLDFGFDGMRVDAVKYLFEGTNDSQWKDQPETIAWFQKLRSSVVDGFPTSAKMMMAENWDGDLGIVKSYLESGGRKGFNMSLDFIWPYTLTANLDGLGSSAEVAALLHHLVDDTNSLPAGSSFGVFESNHDNVVSRPATAFAGKGGRIGLAAALSILGRGVPILYYGNEIGMTGAAGNDINLRQPFDWGAEAAQSLDPDSLWSWNRDLLRLRSGYGAWDDPAIIGLQASLPGVLAFEIVGKGGEKAIIVANTSANALAAATIDIPAPAPASLKAMIGSEAGNSLSGATLTVAPLPAYGLRVFALDDLSAPVLRASDANYDAFQTVQPAQASLFLRGSFNGWAASTPLVAQGGGLFKATFTLAAGSCEFKYGSADWSTGLGSNSLSYDAVRGTINATLFSKGSSPYYNIIFSVPQTGSYAFWYDSGTMQFWVSSVP